MYKDDFFCRIVFFSKISVEYLLQKTMNKL